MSEREAMPYDVVIVGAGPAGLAAAIRLKQLAEANGQELSVCVLEKGSEVGAHILSGAVVDPAGLDELLPDWRESCALAQTPILIRRNVWAFMWASCWKMPCRRPFSIVAAASTLALR